MPKTNAQRPMPRKIKRSFLNVQHYTKYEKTIIWCTRYLFHTFQQPKHARKHSKLSYTIYFPFRTKYTHKNASYTNILVCNYAYLHQFLRKRKTYIYIYIYIYIHIHIFIYIYIYIYMYMFFKIQYSFRL